MHQHERPSGCPHAHASPHGHPYPRPASGAYVSGRKDAGQLVVPYGTKTGVSSAKRSVISQNTAGNPGTAESGDVFGADSAYADFNGDGYQDLVVAVAGEDIGSVADAGRLVVLYGSAAGIDTSTGTQSFAQSTAGAPGSDEKGDFLGTDVKLDDVTGDGRADLMSGSFENGGNGAVLHLPSSGTKITATGSRTVSPSTSGVSTTGYPNFGATFAD
ncbi:FG-GAP repeat domain-containing protein [Streptomyces sp. URMC 128]|uniref:FG-GAP repeat domain-containing protein n=1 Tax=Streptomyces sp. URMC 128 TaxID=3423404 RepID=UPI003F1E0F4B